ncbi:hypothetical protein ABN028_18380 [Actinopolymorpha sp. B17G11]|uniref:hypothetical protein n=1 Tax=Actinopolymorpha sp. B17G11 TaxID=3160861 RepID=UPI0032E482FD
MSGSANTDWLESPWDEQTPEVVKKAIESGLESIRKTLESLHGLDIRTLAVGGGAMLLGGPILGPLVAGSAIALLQDRFNDNIGDALEVLDNERRRIHGYLEGVGNPWRLNHAAGTWGSGIGLPVSEEAGRYGNSQMLLVDYWTGDAEKAYEDLLPDQKAALSHIAQIANGLNQPLTECASHVTQFWVRIGLTIARTLADVATALDNAATPDILSVPVEAAAALVKGVADALENFREMMANFMSSFAEVEALLNSSEAFPGGHWPRSKAVIGDPTRWDKKEA